jgi:hypothetical protein
MFQLHHAFCLRFGIRQAAVIIRHHRLMIAASSKQQKNSDPNERNPDSSQFIFTFEHDFPNPLLCIRYTACNIQMRIEKDHCSWSFSKSLFKLKLDVFLRGERGDGMFINKLLLPLRFEQNGKVVKAFYLAAKLEAVE